MAKLIQAGDIVFNSDDLIYARVFRDDKEAVTNVTLHLRGIEHVVKIEAPAADAVAKRLEKGNF
jgi:hypothetical protein